MTAVGGCGLSKALNPDQPGCHFVDTLGSSNPVAWKLGDVGPQLVNQINAYPNKQDVLFISWIQGEADASVAGFGDRLIGSRAKGGPYDFSSEQKVADHYKESLKALLRLVREGTGLPRLRMVVQLVANYQGATDLIRQAQLDAARESGGAIIIGNANPWQHYRPNGDDWSHYNGQAYMDFSLETGRVVALAIARAGLADTKNGPSYGDFPVV